MDSSNKFHKILISLITANTQLYSVLGTNNPLLFLNSISNRLLHLKELSTSMFLNLKYQKEKVRPFKLIWSILKILNKMESLEEKFKAL